MSDTAENWEAALHSFIESAGFSDQSSPMHQQLFQELGGNRISIDADRLYELEAAALQNFRLKALATSDFRDQIWDAIDESAEVTLREHDERLLREHSLTLLSGLREEISADLAQARLQGGAQMLRVAVEKYPGATEVNWPEWLELLAADLDRTKA